MQLTSSYQAINLISNGAFTNYWVEPKKYVNVDSTLDGQEDLLDEVLYKNPGASFDTNDVNGVLGHWFLSGRGSATVGREPYSREGGNSLVLTIGLNEDSDNIDPTSDPLTNSITLYQDIQEIYGQSQNLGLAFSGAKIIGNPIVTVALLNESTEVFSESFSANSLGAYRRVTRLLTLKNPATKIQITLTGAVTESIALSGVTLINGPSSRYIPYSPSLADKFLPKGLVLMAEGDTELQGFYPLPGSYMAVIGPNPGTICGSESHSHGLVPGVSQLTTVTAKLMPYHNYPSTITGSPYINEVPFVAASLDHTHTFDSTMSNTPGTVKMSFCYKV